MQRDHAQWFLGKSLDTFCPVGPWVTTIDEVPIEA
ncbi:fumarylacetoacetate hydrolase family protein [Dyella flagellata]